MSVRAAQPEDLDVIVALAGEVRREYEKHAPTFHRRASNASAVHRPWLAQLIDDGAVGTFVHEDGAGQVDGFVVATLVEPPPVYDPGGPTCSIDDFAVALPSLWPTAGRALLGTAQDWARERGAAQTVVVCGPHDSPKRQMLRDAGLDVVSEWFTATL